MTRTRQEESDHMEKSRIFLSWSGERSKKVATILGGWLEDVLQTVDPFMSDTDIAAGDVWFDEIGNNLAASQFAIICITPENIESKWLHFEAGAIGMTRSEGARGAVVPYLLGLGTTDLAPPLSLFQAVVADKQGTLRLVQTLNAVLPVQVDRHRLERTFDRWWPDLDSALGAIPEATGIGTPPASRPDRELLEELLSLARRSISVVSPIPAVESRADDALDVLLRATRMLGVTGWKTKLLANDVILVDGELPSGMSVEDVQALLDSSSELGSFRLVFRAPS